ncbi:hypothetical protein CISG_02501 [Coccidioides immitis RMSCC 3703]|uniref:Uncharacterized protein n=1 Tax=Coccidioides immitis RMSCC 3703 TaxID=454286 RepID=A0A0J8R805_COCIT|nr:hypothetical protein CISG_02501 [Coccidioides immitis RMSCC 3703]
MGRVAHATWQNCMDCVSDHVGPWWFDGVLIQKQVSMSPGEDANQVARVIKGDCRGLRISRRHILCFFLVRFLYLSPLVIVSHLLSGSLGSGGTV